MAKGDPLLSPLADGSKATAGPTGDKTMTNPNTGVAPWAATMIALRPA